VIGRLSHSLIASAVIVVLSLAAGVISARALGPSMKGVLAAAILWPAVLAAVGSLGILEAVSFFSARRHATQAVIGTGVAMLAALSIALVAVGYPLLGRVLSEHGPEAVALARRALLCIPLNLLGAAGAAVVLGKGRVGWFNTIRCTQPLVLCGGAAALVITGHGSVGAFVNVAIIATAAGSTLAIVLCAAVAGHGWTADVATARLMLAYGFRSHFGQIASMMNLQLDQVLMSTLLESRALGIYAVAVSIAGGVALTSGALAISSFSQLAAEADERARLACFARVSKAALAVALAGAAALWVLAPHVVLLCFGAAYTEAVPLTRLLLIAAVPLALNSVLSSGFKALNKAIVPSQAQLVGLLATGALLPVLLPRLGAAGAAATSIIAYSLTCVYLLVAVRRHYGLTPRALLWPHADDWHRLGLGLPAGVAR
jgi:O-antigen/teichoic acid export membrane protein